MSPVSAKSSALGVNIQVSSSRISSWSNSAFTSSSDSQRSQRSLPSESIHNTVYMKYLPIEAGMPKQSPAAYVFSQPQ